MKVKNISHPSLFKAGCKSLLVALFCVVCASVNAQETKKTDEDLIHFSFTDVAYAAFNMEEGIWINSREKVVPIKYNGYNYFICCTSPYATEPIFCVMRSTETQQLIWTMDKYGTITGYTETKDIMSHGLEMMTPSQRESYMQLVHAECVRAIMIQSGTVKEERQQ